MGLLLLLWLACSPQVLAGDFAAIVEQQRIMTVLVEHASDDDPASAAIFTARNHYVAKHELVETAMDQAEAELGETSGDKLLPTSLALIDFFNRAPDLHPADKLAFLDLADALLELEQSRSPSPASLSPLSTLNNEVEQVLAAYRTEYGQLMRKLATRGTNPYEPWQSYLDFLHSRYDAEALLAEPPLLHRKVMRGSGLSRDQKDKLEKDKPKVMWGNELPEKTVVLTFDDGPNYSRTPKILDILKQYKVKGYFFSVGKNLGSFNRDGYATAGRTKRVITRMLKEGHILANHSFSHPVMTKLNKEKRQQQLSKTNALIKLLSEHKPALFRPPYGSQNDALAKQLQQMGLISVMWNVDSLDWADPIPESIADRVLRELDQSKRGILLFHDIHKQTIKALPDILEGLHQRGIRVVTLDGSSFDDNLDGIPQPPKTDEKSSKLYGDSWAVVIGINNYQHWPKLKYAVNDARAVAESLQNNLGFDKDHIIQLYDQDATRERIVEVLGYQLADSRRVKPEDRVFIFYAGHGMTRQRANGGDLGYIIPVDAETEKFQNRAISMSAIDDFSSLIAAKHIYYIMDSCYSGLALTRSGMSAGQARNYLAQITRRRARQILTAGGADQQVADSGPGGHSIFTWILLQGLEGLADTDNNGYVTASELGTYVAPVVASYADQTPAFGNLVGSKGGDFVFKVEKDAVERVNKKLTDETAMIEAELKSLKNNAQAKVKRRLELQLALEQAKDGYTSQTTAQPDDQPPSEDRIRQARRYNASAMQYFKEKRYKDAKAELEVAIHLNPYNPTIINNYAYALDMLNENEAALKWYYRTVELDAKRISVYLNLGDLMVELHRPQEAIPYYERYLHLYPSYKESAKLRKTITKLSEGKG